MVFESNLIILFAALVSLTGVGALAGTTFRPQTLRVWRYFRAWWERDRIAEEEARREKQARLHAESELRAACNEDEPVPCGEGTPAENAMQGRTTDGSTANRTPQNNAAQNVMKR